MSPLNRRKLLMLLTAVILLINDIDGQQWCKSEGVFPLQGYCSKYYECKRLEGGNLILPEFLDCPAGTVFDDKINICLEPDLVTSPPECRAVSSITPSPPQQQQQQQQQKQQQQVNCEEPESCSPEDESLRSVTLSPETEVQFTTVEPSVDPLLDTPEDPSVESYVGTLENSSVNSHVKNNVVPPGTTYVDVPVETSEDLSVEPPVDSLVDISVGSSEDLSVGIPTDKDSVTPASFGDSWSVPIEGDTPNAPLNAAGETTTILPSVLDANALTNITEEFPENYDPDYYDLPLITNESENTYSTEMIPNTETDLAEAPSDNDIYRMIQEVAMLSNQSCQHVCVIEKYVNLITSDSVQVGRHQSYCRQNLLRYNSDFERIQNIVRAWRNGNDILSDIKETFSLAKQYELKFDRKYEINQRRRTLSSPSSLSDRIRRLREDIDALEQSITELKEALGQAPPSIKAYFRNTLKADKKLLEKKQQELQDVLGSGSAFLSLTSFLEMVGSDAKIIETKAKNSKTSVDTWRRNLSTVRNALRGHSTTLDRCVKRINGKIRQSSGLISQKQSEIRTLQNQRVALASSKANLDNDVQNNIQKVENATAAIQKKIKEIEKRIKEECNPRSDVQSSNIIVEFINTAIRFIYPEACELMKKSLFGEYNIDSEQEELKKIQATVQKKNKKLFNQINEDSTKRGELAKAIRQRQNRIATIQSEIREAGIKKDEVKVFLSHWERVREAWDSFERVIEEVMRGLGKVGTTFHSIYFTLDSMVTEANTKEKDKVEFQEVRDATDQKLQKLQNEIDQSSDTIQEVRNCY